MNPTSLSSSKHSFDASGVGDAVSQQMVNGPCKLKKAVFSSKNESATLGEAMGLLILHDSNSGDDSAAVKFKVFVGACLGQTVGTSMNIPSLSVPIPGGGIRFDSGIYAVSGRDSGVATPADMKLGTVTLFYEGA